MNYLSLALLIAALIFFIIAAIGLPIPGPGSRFNLVAAGLACWEAAQLIRS